MVPLRGIWTHGEELCNLRRRQRRRPEGQRRAIAAKAATSRARVAIKARATTATTARAVTTGTRAAAIRVDIKVEANVVKDIEGLVLTAFLPRRIRTMPSQPGDHESPPTLEPSSSGAQDSRRPSPCKPGLCLHQLRAVAKDP